MIEQFLNFLNRNPELSLFLGVVFSLACAVLSGLAMNWACKYVDGRKARKRKREVQQMVHRLEAAEHGKRWS